MRLRALSPTLPYAGQYVVNRRLGHRSIADRSAISQSADQPHAPLNCGPERDIPVSRPATRDQAIFVEYLVQKLVHLNSVMSEFAGCVSQSAVEIVAIHLDYCASRMRKG